jgi:large subunit ribosomal protein L24
MKQNFSKKWKASKRPSKQRKYLANAPLHIKAKLLNVHLSKPLREKMKKRNVQIRKDDKVKIMRGKFKGKEGKVLNVSVKYSKVTVEGINMKKMDGSQANVPLKPSNLQIIELSERKIKKEEKTKEVKKPESKEIKENKK